MSSTRIDHFLRTVWTLQEEGEDRLEVLKEQVGAHDFSALLEELEQARLIEVSEGRVRLTKQGERQAERIIRRHRLAERLFADVFDAAQTDYEQLACSFEHIISPEITESVCTFLGHPRVCPHNRPIPPGKCCLAFTTEIRPVVINLTDLALGEVAKIVYMLPSYQKRWKQLHQYGLYPGNKIRLIQKKPSYVVQVGETTLALDKEICKEIFVKKQDRSD